jgi:pimeloyl-ACP methyl ester carboxylesterase
MGQHNSLPALGTDRDTTIIAGFSAGSFMASNLHVVYSDTFKGAGLVAGGPYMTNKHYPFSGLYTPIFDTQPNAEYLTTRIVKDAIQNDIRGKIDKLLNLKNKPVYIMSEY